MITVSFFERCLRKETPARYTVYAPARYTVCGVLHFLCSWQLFLSLQLRPLSIYWRFYNFHVVQWYYSCHIFHATVACLYDVYIEYLVKLMVVWKAFLYNFEKSFSNNCFHVCRVCRIKTNNIAFSLFFATAVFICWVILLNIVEAAIKTAAFNAALCVCVCVCVCLRANLILFSYLVFSIHDLFRITRGLSMFV